jgi:hypothetical protein
MKKAEYEIETRQSVSGTQDRAGERLYLGVKYK